MCQIQTAAMGTLNTEKIFQLPSGGKVLSVLPSSGRKHGCPAGARPRPRWHRCATDSPPPGELHTRVTPAMHTQSLSPPLLRALPQITGKTNSCTWASSLICKAVFGFLRTGEFFIFISCCSQPHPPLFTGSEPPALCCCLRI